MVTYKRRKWLMFESEQETRVTKEEWKPEFNRLRKKSRRLAQKHGECIFRVAQLLMQHETLTDDQIPQLEVSGAKHFLVRAFSNASEARADANRCSEESK